jgi:hypothetical protein
MPTSGCSLISSLLRISQATIEIIYTSIKKVEALGFTHNIYGQMILVVANDVATTFGSLLGIFYLLLM